MTELSVLSCGPDAFGFFHIEGPDARDYLHRQLSNEIRQLEPGEGVPVCYLNAQGRIRLCFNLWRSATGEGYWAAVAGEQKDHFISEMDRMIFREQIQLGPLAEDLTSLLVIGSSACERLQAVLSQPPPEEDFRSISWEVEGAPVHLCRVDWTLLPTWHLIGAKSFIKTMEEKLLQSGASSSRWQDFHSMRIERGQPWPGFEATDAMIPYECGLDSAVSLTKGCYVGQEVIARMANLGSPPRVLKGIRFNPGESEPDLGCPITVGEIEVGQVLSVGYSTPLSAPIALSSVRRKFANPGQAVSIDGKYAVIMDLPMKMGED